MNPAARPGLDQCLGGVFHALDNVLGDVCNGVGRLVRAGLGCHVGLANQYASMSCGRDRRRALKPTVIWIAVEIIPPRVKEPLYRLYELRLRQGLAASKSALPRHIAVLCDGNRRWARDAGYDDVSYGYRMGAVKIAEMLRWCQEAGIEMATVYLLSTDNLRRDPGELTALIQRHRSGANPTKRRRNILSLHRSDDIARRQIEGGELVRIDPHAQGIVERPK